MFILCVHLVIYSVCMQSMQIDLYCFGLCFYCMFPKLMKLPASGAPVGELTALPHTSELGGRGTPRLSPPPPPPKKKKPAWISTTTVLLNVHVHRKYTIPVKILDHKCCNVLLMRLSLLLETPPPPPPGSNVDVVR